MKMICPKAKPSCKKCEHRKPHEPKVGCPLSELACNAGACVPVRKAKRTWVPKQDLDKRLEEIKAGVK